MKFKFLSVLLATLVAIMGVSAGAYVKDAPCEDMILVVENYLGDECLSAYKGGYVYNHCSKHFVDKGMKFGETSVCSSLPSLKSYSMPYETQPEVRETYVYNVEEVEDKEVDVTVLDNSVRFGESLCDGCNSVVLNEYSEPYKTEPRDSEGFLIKFIKNCFFYN